MTQDPSRLDGKLAVITGGGSGIGEATAHVFAEAGATVVVAGRRLEPLEKVAKAVGGHAPGGFVNIRKHCLGTDVGDMRRRGDPSALGNDDLVARTDTQAEQQQVNGRRAVWRHHGIFSAVVLRELLLEVFDVPVLAVAIPTVL